MKNHQAKLQEKETQSPPPISPNSTSSSSSSSSNNGGAPAASALPLPNPVTPKPISRSIDANPYPTTFIQADSTSFKQVVQMLTGSAETAAKHAATSASPPPPKNPLPPAAKTTGPKKPAFKLYERRSGLKNLKMINPLMPSFVSSSAHSPMGGGAGFSPRAQPEILSPSILDFPSLALSPVTPLIPDPFNRSPPTNSAPAAMSAEDRAIAERGFYLHPSPRTTPRVSDPPRLLALFPETSPLLPWTPAAGTST